MVPQPLQSLILSAREQGSRLVFAQSARMAIRTVERQETMPTMREAIDHCYCNVD